MHFNDLSLKPAKHKYVIGKCIHIHFKYLAKHVCLFLLFLWRSKSCFGLHFC